MAPLRGGSLSDSLADPGTTLGQLQRGRGAGWIAAARSPDGRELLRWCLERDPRWDAQVEDRADYYARLALELGLGARDVDPDGLAADEDTRALCVDVLGRLAVRGDDDARRRLQLELERSGDRLSVLWWLAEVPDARGLEGVDAILVRVCAPEDLVELVADTTSDRVDSFLPWERWAGRQPKIAAAMSAGHELRRSWVRTSTATVPSADVPAAEVLHQAVTGPWSETRRFAWMALQQRRDPIAVDAAAEAFCRGVIGAERAFVFRYLEALAPDVMLPFAREWVGSDDDRVSVAAATLARHATPTDVPGIQAALERAWEKQWMYVIGDLIDALARVPTHGPYPLLAAMFTEVAYSRVRHHAAAALAACDPSFAGTFAVECLWDCESDTRLLGIETADASLEQARDGLIRLSEDPFESEGVRSAARQRR